MVDEEKNKSNSMRPEISVVVPFFNEENRLIMIMANPENSTHDPIDEIIFPA